MISCLFQNKGKRNVRSNNKHVGENGVSKQSKQVKLRKVENNKLKFRKYSQVLPSVINRKKKLIFRTNICDV